MLKNLNKNYYSSLLYFITAFVIFQSIVVIVTDINREPWGDEYHFVQTIKQFGDDINFDTLTHYKEMSGPFPFIVYSLWGSLFGFDLYILRLLSILIALASYILFHYLVYSIFKNGVLALLSAVFIMIHPYMAGFSIFVFTDGITILFLILVLYGVYKDKFAVYCLAMAIALISRQFAIFFLIATVIYSILKGISANKKMLLGSLLSVIPYLGLVTLWKGFSPDNDWRIMYLNDGLSFHLNYMVLYICLLFVYLLPWVIWKYKEIYNNKWILVISLLFSFIYWFFPVKPSKYDIANNTYTVGLFNKLLVWINPSGWFDQAVFYVCFLLGLPILMTLGYTIGKAIMNKKIEIAILLDLSLFSFLLVMPFSYLGWEKYFIPLVPYMVIRLILLNRTKNIPNH